MSSVSYESVLSRKLGFTTLTANTSVFDEVILRSLPATANVIVCDTNFSIIASNVATSSLWYLNGVTSSLQAQLDSKVTAGAAGVGVGNLTANNVTLGNILTLTSLTAQRALVTDANKNVVASAVTATELGYLGGVTSAVQTQLNAKQATVTGAATTITGSDLTINRALLSDASGKVAVSAVTNTEMSYLTGLSSNVQLQLNAKASLSGATFTGAIAIPDGTLDVPGINFATDTAGGAGLRYTPSPGVSTIQIVTAGTVGIQQTSSSVTFARNVAVNTGYIFTLNNLSNDSRVLQCNASKQVEVSAVTTTELGYLSGVTSAVQTQLNAKQATITGAATTITGSNLTINRALLSDASGKVAVSAVTNTEMSYLGGVTSAVQTQLNAKAPLAAPTFTGLATTGDLQITGNLTILGNTTTVNTDQLAVEDPVVVVNSGGLAQPAGLFIQQPTGTSNVAVVYQAGNLSVFSTVSAANATSYAVESYAGVRAKTLALSTGSSVSPSLALTDEGTTGVSGAADLGGSVFIHANGAVAARFSNPNTDPALYVQGQMQARTVQAFGGDHQLWNYADFSSTTAITWANLQTGNDRLHLMGTLHISVTNSSTATPKVGYATASVIWTRTDSTTYVELDVVPIMIHKNSALVTFNIAKSSLNDEIKVFVDVGCQIAWQFFGSAKLSV